MHSALTHRPAEAADLPVLRALMDAAMAELLPAFLSPAQVRASRAVMGLDTQLVADRTYYLVEIDGRPAGCGGWSRRATLYGGDHSDTRDARLLDPSADAARVRAMYTHPDAVRQGVGRLILGLCEAAAIAEGFGRATLMATLPGEPLYRACGYVEVARTDSVIDGVALPLIRMEKGLPLKTPFVPSGIRATSVHPT